MTTLTEGRHPGEFLLSEANFHRSREAVTVGASQDFDPCTVLAKLAVVADVVAVATTAAGNTASSGTIAMESPAVDSTVKDGRYVGVASAATKVDWVDPDGAPIGVSTHGAAFTKGGISVKITAGGTPNVVGDVFYVDVAADAGDFHWVAFNQDGTDGSEAPAGIAIYGATTPADGTASIAAIVRDAEANGNCIAWPTDITGAEKTNAEQALAALGIIVRN